MGICYFCLSYPKKNWSKTEDFHILIIVIYCFVKNFITRKLVQGF